MAKNPTILWGYHPVWEALQARRREIFGLFLVQDKMGRLEKMARLAQASGVKVQMVSTQQLTEMVGHDRHQGVAAHTAGYPFVSLEQILAADPKALFVLVLDQIVDPQNLGAMARTAHCAGIHGMVIPKDRAAAPTAAASKASAGALEHIPLARVTNVAKALNSLKARGLWIVGADRHGDTNLFDADLTGPLALVIGGEEKGLRPLVKQQCDFSVAIPQVGPIGSLNASVAAAVLMYEAFRQRRK
jgi:23S rRNA (guanosine2251-2'-O)-methyltransferase